MSLHAESSEPAGLQEPHLTVVHSEFIANECRVVVFFCRGTVYLLQDTNPGRLLATRGKQEDRKKIRRCRERQLRVC